MQTEHTDCDIINAYIINKVPTGQRQRVHREGKSLSSSEEEVKWTQTGRGMGRGRGRARHCRPEERCARRIDAYRHCGVKGKPQVLSLPGEQWANQPPRAKGEASKQ